MNIIVLDFETFYSQEFSLTKVTNEEYVRSPEFEVIGVSVQRNADEPEWFSGTMAETAAFLTTFDWENSLALAHNAAFDASILTWVFGIKPKGWLDTLSMGRALHGTEVGGSLAVLAKHYGVGTKGDEVIMAKGLRRTDFPADQLARYGEYCCNDTAMTYALFQKMATGFPPSELRLIDLTIRMFSEPRLWLDAGVLESHLTAVRFTKQELMSKMLIEKDQLMSNNQLAKVLEDLGVEVPMKKSPTTGKQTYAFSKTDEGFKALLEHENVIVQAIVAARLGVKSTIEETRTARFIGIAERGPMPVPLRYYAAHTGRWGGDDKLNLQNLPRNSPLKYAIIPADGYVILDSDSSQIEARTLAWLAGQDDLVDAFDRGEDVYKIMASAIYGKPIELITKDERFVGKTTILGCISEGTLVLSDSGWKPIEQVSINDKLWDGEEWVCHQGLQNSGIKETLNLCGMWLTPDHKVWSGTQWLEAQSLVQDADTRSQVLGTAVENLPLQATFADRGEALLRLSSNVTADPMSTAWTTIISKISKARAVHFVPKLLRTKNGFGCIRTQWAMMGTEHDCSIDWLLPSQGATPQLTERTSTTGGAVYQFTNSGEQTGLRFSSMFKRLMGGMYQAMRWIGLTSTVTTNPTISDLSPEATTSKTNAELQPSNRKLQTYDLAYSGPRNRYMVLTEQGPMIVHNCGYGMGAAKFKLQLKNFGVEVELEEAKRIIDTYRATYPMIVKLWATAGNMLKAILQNQQTSFGRGNLLEVDGSRGIKLPNGLYLRYPNLRLREDEESGKVEVVYDTKKGKAVIPNRIYGGKVIENVCQALARIVIGEQMLVVNKKYPVVMTVHDAIATVVPEAEAETAKEYVELCMRLRPSWAPELPLNCEAGYGESYGDC
jgi:DNA polymerase I-like protein with 3'-5' exonuclease and polymerase domains